MLSIKERRAVLRFWPSTLLVTRLKFWFANCSVGRSWCVSDYRNTKYRGKSGLIPWQKTKMEDKLMVAVCAHPVIYDPTSTIVERQKRKTSRSCWHTSWALGASRRQVFDSECQVSDLRVSTIQLWAARAFSRFWSDGTIRFLGRKDVSWDGIEMVKVWPKEEIVAVLAYRDSCTNFN